MRDNRPYLSRILRHPYLATVFAAIVLFVGSSFALCAVYRAQSGQYSLCLGWGCVGVQLSPFGDCYVLTQNVGLSYQFGITKITRNAILPRYASDMRQTVISIPTVYLLGLNVAIIILMLRNKRGDNDSKCLKCSYDLRGSPTNLCPECGTLNKFSLLSLSKTPSRPN